MKWDRYEWQARAEGQQKYLTPSEHGGPELFTFDNHKGGPVLLNDGTVKFIRTEEELQQLRWK
jgi:hypothetical protein